MNVGTQREARGELAHLRTLADCVKLFVKEHGRDGTHDKVMPFVMKSKTFKQAIERSVDGAMENGKKFHFGTCVRNSSKEEWCEALVSRQAFLKKCENFDQLYDWMANLAPWGIGDFSKYVTAQRVAAYLRMKPEKFVYLHAGPAKGYKALMGRSPKGFREPLSSFPKELQALSPHKVEDFLCEFRETLPRIEWKGQVGAERETLQRHVPSDRHSPAVNKAMAEFEAQLEERRKK